MSARRVVFALALACGSVAAPAHAETIAIIGATVHTMTAEAPIENATVVMRDGRIVAVGASVDVPADARRIDAHGRVVTPALFNPATQLGLTEVSSIDATNDASVNSGPLGASFDIQYALNPRSLLIRQAAADGLGRAVSFPTGAATGPFAGFGALLHLGGDPLLERPRIAMFASVGGASKDGAGGSRSAQWQLMRAALDEAKAFRSGTRAGAPRDSAFSRVDLAALKPVADGTAPLVIDADRESDIRQAVALARDLGIRVIVKGGLEAWRAADLLAAARVPVILDPSVNLPLYFDELGARGDGAAILQRAGVLIAFEIGLSVHTTINAGYGLRQVAGLAAASGMAPGDALAAITRNPAQIWGVADRSGSLAPGLDADLVVWDGDPLEPLTNVVTAYLGGREVSQDTRQRELRERYRPRTTS